MEMTPDAAEFLEAAGTTLRPMKRIEYDRLVEEGFFEDEKVELLFGLVVPMSPIDSVHRESVRRLNDMLNRQLDGRAFVYSQTAFAASDDSEPEPDVYAVPLADYWHDHPSHAYLVIEVAVSSLRRDRAKRRVYAVANVDEYWIVNQVDACVEVYRECRDGTWHSLETHRRGDSVSLLAFPDVKIPVDEILPPA